MTQEEFNFWQRAYLQCLSVATPETQFETVRLGVNANLVANMAVDNYRAAKATVVQYVERPL
jgi:hypothetical protein